MDLVLLLMVGGGFCFFAWMVGSLLYVARIHHELKRHRQENANLMRALLNAQNAGAALPVAGVPEWQTEEG